MEQQEVSSLIFLHSLVLVERKIKECFALRILLNNPETDLEQAVHTSMIIDQANKAMISGRIHPEDMLEWIEPHMKGIIPMDNYIEDVEENLSLILPT